MKKICVYAELSHFGCILLKTQCMRYKSLAKLGFLGVLLTVCLTFHTIHASCQLVRVTRVIDGDTFVIESGERVRMIGINAPEISDFYGPESKQQLASKIEGRLVTLQSDALSKDRDRYQRLLRYVDLDGQDVNLEMIIDGFAFAYLKFKFDRSEEYVEGQLEARSNGKGIWGGELSKGQSVKDAARTDVSFGQHLPVKFIVIIVLIGLLVFVGFYALINK